MSRARDVAAAVAELRADYRRALPARLRKLEDALARARADAGALREAIAEAHRIRGTGGSLGFGELGEAAGRIEEAAEEIVEDKPAEPAWAEIEAAAAALAAAARDLG